MLGCLRRTPRFTRGGGVELSDNQISFKTSTVNGWQGINSSSRAAVTVGENGPLKMESSLGYPLYLHPIEQSGTYIYNAKDELITRSGAPLPSDGNLLANNHDAKTRGAKFTDASLTNAFGVSAILTNNNTTSSYFQNLKATPSGGSWITSDAKYWPTNGSLSFYAYYPYSTDSHNMLSEDATVDVNKARTVHYVASANDVEHQPDLIIAKHENVTHGLTEAPNSVNLNFSHVLTAITFAVGSDMVPGTVKSIAIKGVRNTGDYDLSTGQWTTSGADADFKINLGNNGQGIAFNGQQDEALTTGDQTLMMIPQTFDANSNAKIEIVFTPTNGQERTLSASLAGTDWTEGSTIIYKVSTSSLLPTLTLNNITFPTDWSNHAEYGGKLKSAYQDNEQLGLYVVAPDGRVKAANVQVTCKGGKWTFPAAGQPHINTNDKVFAYYPYQQSPQGNLPSRNQTVDVKTLTDANAFFKTLEAAWTPQTDQSNKNNLNASDLQVANAILNSTGSGIDLTMAHAMGLADITIGTGQVHFKLSNDANYTWDNPHLASEQFADKKPCKVADAHYVAIVKPNMTTKFNSAAGVDYAWKSELSFSPAANQIAKETAIPVDKKEINPYTLKLSDIYYSDGSLTHPSDGLTKGKTPIGIVGYIAQGGDDYWVEKNTKQSGIGGHAVVMCLKMLGSTSPTDLGKPYALRVNSDDWSNEIPYIGDYDNEAMHIKSSKNQKNGSGYLSTKCMAAHLSPAGIAALAYKDLPAPEKSTGWFVPSIGQYFALLEQMSGAPFQLKGWNRGLVPGCRKIRDAIEKDIEFAGDNNNYTQFFQVGQETLTSTAMTNRDNWFVTNYDCPPYGVINLFDGLSADYESYEAHPVRPFLAF